MHHVVFSKPGAIIPAARLQKLLKDPRYILQQELRAAMAAPPSLPAPLSADGKLQWGRRWPFVVCHRSAAPAG
jgi:hypothetical protein